MSVASYFASLSVPNLFSRMPAGVAQGMIWGLMALGVYITFRLLDIADLSVDGTFATGGAVTVMLMLAGRSGAMAAKILKGESKISEMPIEYYQNPVKKYNQALCEAHGITVPDGYEAIA